MKLESKKRLCIISFASFALFSLLVYRFFTIQIIEGEKWTRIAKKQHFFVLKEPFHRGRFIANSSIKQKHPVIEESFVIDVQKFHLYADPSSIPEQHKNAIAASLMKKLNLSIDEKLRFQKQFHYKSRSRRLAMWLDSEAKEKVLDWWGPYAKKHKLPRNAIFFARDYQRSYPFGKLLGQVLHTVQGSKDEVSKQAIPTGGLELVFNDYLKGKTGKRRLMRSPKNSLETGEIIIPPQDGADVYLTINHCLQAIAEEEIAKGVKACNAKSGWAVMMDPKTGYILALAQYPFFDPSNYQKFFNQKDLLDATRVKAVVDANEPGSTMKPLTVAIALVANEELQKRGEKPLFSKEEKISTSNPSFPGRNKPLMDTRLHYYLNMNMAMQKSSNIYMGRLVERIIARLGKDWYRKTLSDVFGLGKKTNIELPGESRGVLPLPGKKHPNGSVEWSLATPFSMAMGHNLQVNSIQMVSCFATLANGGVAVQPTLVKKIVKKRADGTEEVLVDHESERWFENRRRVLSREIANDVVKSMKFVTKPGGTSSRADVFGYTEAGKSSTAKKIVEGSYSNTKTFASFVGFTPVEDPAFVLLIAMDEPEYKFIPGYGKNHHGGTCAAPVFRSIATQSLAYLGVPPDDPHGYPQGDPRFDPAKADWIKETRELKEMYEKWNIQK